MSERSSPSTAGADPGGYGVGARVFHWATVLVVVVQIPAGIAMTSEPLAAWADPLYILHKGLGAAFLALVSLRILWRITHRPPRFPDHMPPLEKKIAGRTHIALYVLLFVMAASGYLRTVGDNYPIELFEAIGIPPLLSDRPELAQAMLVVHQFTVIVLVALIAIHIAAVLRHQLIERDGMLSRMWPPFAGRERGAGTSGDHGAGDDA